MLRWPSLTSLCSVLLSSIKTDYLLSVWQVIAARSLHVWCYDDPSPRSLEGFRFLRMFIRAWLAPRC